MFDDQPESEWVSRAAARIQALDPAIGARDAHDLALAIARKPTWQTSDPYAAIDETFRREGRSPKPPASWR